LLFIGAFLLKNPALKNVKMKTHKITKIKNNIIVPVFQIVLEKEIAVMTMIIFVTKKIKMKI
jgi:hypothetical protein